MAYQTKGRDPLLDSNMAMAIEKRGKELAGLALIALGVMAAMMIGSYTPDDPSWLSATDAPVQNWMGRFGASLSAPLFMIVGKGAWGIAVVLAAWGLRLALHRGDDRAVSRLIFAPIAIALASVYASTLVPGDDWTHSFGLGGLFGDTVLGTFLNILPLGTAFGLKVVSFLMGVAILAVGAFVLGFTQHELKTIGRFLLIGIIMAYATAMNLAGRGASGALARAQDMQHRAQARREQRRIEKAEAAEWAALQQTEEYAVASTIPAAHSATRVRRPATDPVIDDEPFFERPAPIAVVSDHHAPFDDEPLIDMPQDKPGFLSRMMKRTPLAADPEPELVEPQALDFEADMPTEERIKSKIGDVIRSRVRAPQGRATTVTGVQATGLTKGRGRGPSALVLDTSRPRMVMAEPPLTAAHRELPPEPPLTAQHRDALPPEPALTAPRRPVPAAPAAARVSGPRRVAAEPIEAPVAREMAPWQDEADWAEAALAPADEGYDAPGVAYAAEDAYADDGYTAELDDAEDAYAAEADDRYDDPAMTYDDEDPYDGFPADDEPGYAAPAPQPRVAAPIPAAPVAQPAKVVHPTRKPMQPSTRARAEAQPSLKFDDATADYELPPLSLLRNPASIERHHLSDEALEENARMLESVLDDYGVKGEIVSVRPGPVVTMYELEPAPGLKASRVIGLADDIARSMSALSARVSTVPGRSVIGIELPNEKREMVSFREILSSRDYGDRNHKLPLALGKDIGGDPMVANLAKMPHLLIAGTTGSGKSVAINTMILSLLYQLTPDDLRLVMIDPKMLELSVYDGIPHLLSPVVTDPKKAVVALKWVVGEMEDRYRKMSKMGVRNIDGYNSRVADALSRNEMFERTVQTGFDDETGEPIFESEEFEPRKMPYIVVIVDEMADLMMVAGKEIEACIQRLAQMARASGIHIIMATQRPSVDVITGTIKANFPTRISFQVTSKVDSRTILGEMGAEQLLGMGDMLYMAGGAKITRCHGPFVSDEEVEEVVNHLKQFGPPEYVGGVVEGPDEEKADNIDAVLGLNTGGNTGGEDALYDQAVAIVIKDRKCSTSYIQRKLGIGYNKAARLVEQMEDEGVVSASNHVGKREILVPEQQ
ncbi:DNA translocase FtsK [Mesobacterium pallidum]|uniref:DNA translocase FtsK n=1 Tax=Mesobacterium pallidum TaxID=2872037 RepID=UPI001EE27406|nr:DNA translocase FtsK [Mesobacterium pallidum]